MRLANHGPCLWLADASPEYQVFPVLSLILILLMSPAACCVLGRYCVLLCCKLAHNALASPIDLVDISPLRPPIVSLVSQ